MTIFIAFNANFSFLEGPWEYRIESSCPSIIEALIAMNMRLS